MWNDNNLLKILIQGSIAVMPTDTIYGIVGRAEDPLVVERIYKARKRNPDKPCIILIGTLSDLSKFSIVLSEAQKNKLNECWPGPVSVILDCPDEKLQYLHRGTKTLAFRLPLLDGLRELLIHTGPLVAPSANPEGEPVAKNVEEAKKYFGNSVDIYVDGGKTSGTPSKVIRLHEDGSVSILRK